MSVLITALDGATVVTDPSAETLSKWAYERHTETCATCRTSDGWCSTGRALLAATAPNHHDLLPGYLTEPVPAYPSI